MNLPVAARSTLPRTAAAIAVLLAAAAAAADARTTAAGVYTTEQAQEGRVVHREHCARCHDRSYYTGTFLSAWQQVPVATLYDVIEMKMPEDDPGSLPPRDYAAVLAWIFQLNGLPAGDERLPHDQAAMGRILITGE